jgi:ribosomal protein S18 acetylase RimI-like enzyme
MERIVRDAAQGGEAPGAAGNGLRDELACHRPSDAPYRSPPAVTWRHERTSADVRGGPRGHGFRPATFNDFEVPVAVELAEERLAKGAASGYEFVVAECAGRVVGYTSFGPVPCTKSSFDWYWLAVRPEYQGFGIGRELLAHAERRAKAMGGTRLFCETSGRPKYASTRAFYERLGFTLCELLDDFYDDGDGRATYSKPL